MNIFALKVNLFPHLGILNVNKSPKGERSMISTQANIPGYQVSEELYNGPRTLVYRAFRETDNLPVVIKLLKNPYPSFSELVQFHNQYTIAKNVNYPGIIQTYNLEQYQNGYIFVMEDFGGISLKNYFTKNNHRASLQEFLQIAISLCDTLDILYRQRIIHKDIKPANILINPQTKQVKLIDFSIASLLPRATQILVSPNVLEGTLAYISPEQTGRMNRGIDYRTDFYSLGVTFYELLTGNLPFESNEPMELLHCHIAKMPPVLENREEIPQVISDIVMKLMAKNSEDRYQSALGLKHDLEICLDQIKETGKIKNFEIGKQDICDRFIIPDKLYGRETEVEILLQAFERVTMGTTEMMLVAGFSGIGKTAVVNEVHKPIVKQRGYFIKGKYDQFNRNIPFSAFVQAFRDLMGQLLTESDTQIEQWKTKILSALGKNAQVIIEVIPELERIIGQQPSVSELSGSAAQNRFNLLFEKFIQVFTTKEHPLLIFLDDLQWADLASLKLIQLLMSQIDSKYLLLIGAYRDNEVKPLHPLILTLEEIRKTSATINTITLAPLKQYNLNHLIADTLNCSLKIALPLTELVYQKTKGNPFFANQLLKSFYEEDLLWFNFEAVSWQCDIAQMKELTLSDDVVEFMALQLEKLPFSAQEVLKLAACIGNSFDLKNLAIVYEKSLSETATDLWKALQDGLIIPTSEVYKFFQSNDCESSVIGNGEESTQFPFTGGGKYTNSQFPNYKFLHDRVQQAAYSLIPEDKKQSTHLKIGQLLLSNTPETEREEKIFEIVNQLNIGMGLINHQTERDQLAQLNLLAGRKAKASTAYGAAVEYLTVARELLGADSWQNQYDLTLALYDDAVEAAHLSGSFEEMEQLSQVVLQQAKTLLEKVKVYDIQIQAYAAQNKLLEAVKTGLAVLKLLGIEISEQSTQSDIQMELEEVKANLTGKRIEDLINLPEMKDPTHLAAMKILSMVAGAAYNAIPQLLPLIVYKQVNLSVKHGNIAASTVAYAYYSAILCGGMTDIETGYEFGKLALSLSERFHDAKEFTYRASFIIHACVIHWKESVRENLQASLRELYSGLLEAGALEFAGYCAYCYCYNLYLMGSKLQELEGEMAAYSDALRQLKLATSLSYNEIYRQTVLNLISGSENPCYLIGESCDEQKLLPFLKQTNDITGIFHLYFNKFILHYLFGEFVEAADNAEMAEKYLSGVTGTILVSVFYFYDSLVELSQYANASNESQKLILEKVAINQGKMQIWAHHAPINFLHKLYLVEAEQHRILGENLQAMDYYDRAISAAKENQFLSEEALANELAAKFYFDWGKEKIAAGYMQESYYCYARWGAKTKTSDLEKHYPQLLKPILQQQQLTLTLNPLETISSIATVSHSSSTYTNNTNISDALDFTSVLKAAQTISSSIELDKLVACLTKIILEYSGAKKTVLILSQESKWQVQAITFTNQESNSQLNNVETIIEPQLIEDCQDIPRTIINYVKNTQETVVIDNCQTDISGLIGEYMLEHQPKSVLCTPIINQGHLLGILYLENQLTTGVFSKERLQVIKLLSSQAAISLENAQLYQKAQQALQDLQQAQLKIVQSEKMSALGNLVAGVAHEMNNPLGFIYATLQQTKPTLADIVEHLQIYQKTLSEKSKEIIDHAEEIDLDYSLEDLPKMIDSMVMACDRLTNISTSLRTFSRADKDYKVAFNIHEGIDSTILILKHRLKANDRRPAIEVITEYGELPQVECFPGELNQVLMNILANAIDALDESNNGLTFAEIKINPNKITIKTFVEDNQVKISIADNGKGMNEEVKNKIFEHLFTTKGVGKGTGLGLAIARQIIEDKHGGKLNCNSILGQGTEFMIEIPM